MNKESAHKAESAVIQRTYRFNAELFEEFERACASHLANPKRVIEALIVHWLQASDSDRGTIAEQFTKRFGYLTQRKSKH